MSVLKESKVEAKGVSKAKKFSLLVNDNYELTFNSGAKEDDATLCLTDKYSVAIESKKKFVISKPSSQMLYTVTTSTDDEAAQWVDLLQNLIQEAIENMYFGVELTQVAGPDMIPSIIRDTVNRISNFKETNGIFRISGSKNEIDTLKKAYNSKNKPISLDDYDIYVVTGLLKLYLRELPNPLCTFEYYNDFLACASSGTVADSIKECIRKLPEAYQVNLKYLIQFVKSVGDLSEINQMTYFNLAVVIGPNILRPKTEATEFSNDSDFITRVVECMIANADTIFAEVSSTSMTLPRVQSKVGFQLPPPLRAPPTISDEIAMSSQPSPGFKLPSFPPKRMPPKQPLSQSQPNSPLKKFPPLIPPRTPTKSPGIARSESMMIMEYKEKQDEEEQPVKSNLVRSPSASHLSNNKIPKEKKEEKKEEEVKKIPSDKPEEAPSIDDAWKEYESEGRKYYFNEITNITQWEKPEGFSPKPVKVKKHKKRGSNIEGGKSRSVTVSTSKSKRSKEDADTMSLKPSPLFTPPPLVAPIMSEEPCDNESRISSLEKKVAELELVVKRQSQLLEKLMGKMNE